MARATSVKVTHVEFFRVCEQLRRLLELEPDVRLWTYQQIADRIGSLVGTPVSISTISDAGEAIGVRLGKAARLAERPDTLDSALAAIAALERRVEELERIATAPGPETNGHGRRSTLPGLTVAGHG